MPTFPYLLDVERSTLLEPPHGPTSMVLDTDTYNEIDDQYALVYALLSANLKVEAVYAAPFFNRRSSGPADGMEKSYEEILRVFDKLQRDPQGLVFRGSTRYLASPAEPILSPAAEDLVSRAMAQHIDPLYVVAIGAITNVASAILLNPAIIPHIVVVWLGGEPSYWTQPMTRCFNLWQDVAAARVIFDSGVPLVHIPCTNVAEHLRSTLPEIEWYVKGRGDIGDYLYTIFRALFPDHFARSWVIWDICNVAYLVNSAWVPTELRPSPLLQETLTWGAVNPGRHLIREALAVNRDAIFADLFHKIAAHTA